MYGEFSFFSFNKRSDWLKGSYDNLSIEEFGLSINKTEKYSNEQTIFINNLVGPSSIIDFTLGKEGRMYLLDDQSSLWVYDYTNDHLEQLTQSPDERFSSQSLIASYNDLLYVADPTGMIIAYSLSNGQIMWKRTSWEGGDLFPIAITVDKNGHLYVLVPTDVERNARNEHYLRSDAGLLLIKLSFAGTILDAYKISEFVMSQKKKLIYMKNQFLLASSPNGLIYIFDLESNHIIVYKNQVVKTQRINIQSTHSFSHFCVDSNESIFLGEYRRDEMMGDDHRFIQIYNREGQYLSRISNYRGSVNKIMIDSKDRLFIWNDEEKLFLILSLKSRTMERPSTNLLEGIFLSTALDTKVEKTRWHKILTDAVVPKETQIKISYFASDQKRFHINGELVHLDEFILDQDIDFQEKERLLDMFWTNSMTNAEDALFFGAEGRYIWLKIQFVGSEKQAPYLRKLRVYFPRMSYLSYLPALYQEDSKSSEFLERFLSLFEKFLAEMDEHIKKVPSYFTAESISGDMLRWLSTWLGITVDESWSDQQLKKLLEEASTLYKKRGTKAALEKIIEIYIGEKPIIVEQFQLKTYKKDAAIKEVIARLYGDNPYCFYILVKPYTIQSEKVRIIVQKIIEDEKPAFTEARLVVLEPWIYLDMHTYLGVNTYLSEQSLMTLDNTSYMPSDTVLIDWNRENRLDVHTRVELDSTME